MELTVYSIVRTPKHDVKVPVKFHLPLGQFLQSIVVRTWCLVLALSTGGPQAVHVFVELISGFSELLFVEFGHLVCVSALFLSNEINSLVHGFVVFCEFVEKLGPLGFTQVRFYEVNISSLPLLECFVAQLAW